MALERRLEAKINHRIRKRHRRHLLLAIVGAMVVSTTVTATVVGRTAPEPATGLATTVDPVGKVFNQQEQTVKDILEKLLQDMGNGNVNGVEAGGRIHGPEIFDRGIHYTTAWPPEETSAEQELAARAATLDPGQAALRRENAKRLLQAQDPETLAYLREADVTPVNSSVDYYQREHDDRQVTSVMCQVSFAKPGTSRPHPPAGAEGVLTVDITTDAEGRPILFAGADLDYLVDAARENVELDRAEASQSITAIPTSPSRSAITIPTPGQPSFVPSNAPRSSGGLRPS